MSFCKFYMSKRIFRTRQTNSSPSTPRTARQETAATVTRPPPKSEATTAAKSAQIPVMRLSVAKKIAGTVIALSTV